MLQAITRRLTALEDIPHSQADDRGRALYEWRLRHIHQLDLSPEDILVLGANVYGKTIHELEVLAEQIESGTSWQDLSRRARRVRPAGPEDLLPLCRRLALEAWRFTEAAGWVSVPDVAVELGIKEGKARRDKPYAWYQPGRREGRFYLGTYMVTPVPADLEPPEVEALLDDLNEHWLRVIALHEAIPGHHLQFAVASNVKSRVRDWGYTSIFVEGWGLYCEDSMARHGYFTDPLGRIEQLRMRLWRAARVRIDPGLHTGTMDREAAERLLVEGVLTNPDNARREVDRYLKDPTQPMSYIVGQLQMDELRREHQARAGAGWDERAFHDRLLSFGPIPVALIAAVMLEERDDHDRAHRWSRDRF